MIHSSRSPTLQALIGAGVLLVGVLLAWGATSLPEGVGYSGVGPAVLPWFVSGGGVAVRRAADRARTERRLPRARGGFGRRAR